MVARVWRAESFFGVDTSKGTVRIESAHGGYEVGQGGGCGVGGRSFGHRSVFGKLLDGLGDAFSARFNDEISVAAVMKCRWSKVPCRGAMGCPAFSFARCIVSNNLRSERAEGSSIKIEGAVELRVG